ncbi:ferrochelatase [mine drainage metagenome]|uniref:Ferrochelatase n=1 Tax=mine drainage metagenome TaxID=410659 RepID=A0A1J5RYJ5_9ZZZZ
MAAQTGKLAVVLFNLGGPDSLEAVRPFLFNLFNDAAIIGAPNPIRWLLARFISGRRAPVARAIYEKIGGKSPLLDLTRQQAAALQQALAAADPGSEVRCFIAMRYWHPLTEETVAEVAAWKPDRILLLPLYPHYAGPTTGSSLLAWNKAARRAGLRVPTQTVCCWPDEAGMIAAQADLLTKALAEAGQGARVLFSAHGLPQAVIDKGDPYQAQIERTAAAVVAALGRPDLDWRICYQSRVGPMQWLKPSTDDEIRRAGQEGKPLVVVPIAFVSEHSETLVELDLEYGHLAKECGVPRYVRVPALGCHPAFIAGLADLARRALATAVTPCSHLEGRLCAGDRSACPHQGPILEN